MAWQQIVQLAASLTTHLSQRLSPVIARIPPLPLTSRIAPRWRLPIAGCLIMMSLPLTGIVSFGGLNPLNAAVSSLPAPISGFFRSVEDYVLRSTATHKNGLMWIEVSDPRTRKTEKLPSPRR